MTSNPTSPKKPRFLYARNEQYLLDRRTELYSKNEIIYNIKKKSKKEFLENDSLYIPLLVSAFLFFSITLLSLTFLLGIILEVFIEIFLGRNLSFNNFVLLLLIPMHIYMLAWFMRVILWFSQYHRRLRKINDSYYALARDGVVTVGRIEKVDYDVKGRELQYKYKHKERVLSDKYLQMGSTNEYGDVGDYVYLLVLGSMSIIL